MATLTAEQLADLRRRYVDSRNGVPGTVKAPLDAAAQAIETWFEANRASLSAAIEAAAPGVFTGPQKAGLVKFWLAQKFERGG